MRRPLRPPTGFTMIELLVTVAVLAVLASIAVPSMNDLIRDSRLSSQSDMLVTALNLARQEAVQQRRDIQLCPVPNDTTSDTATACSTSASWNKGMLIVTSGGTLLHRIPAAQGISITNTATNVSFTGTLGSTALQSTFTLCITGRQTQTVTVSASGRATKSIGSAICQ